LAVSTRAFVAARQVGPETFTILPDAFIVLARTTRTKFLRPTFLFERIRPLLDRGLNRTKSLSTNVFFGVGTSNTRAESRITYFPTLKAGTVQLEAPRTNAVASLFPRRDFIGYGAASCVCERSGVPRHNRLYCLSSNNVSC
jgi:hypothetical protein